MDSYFDRAMTYAIGVLDGDTPACIYVKQACQRSLSDLERASKNKDIWFDIAAAEKRCSILEKFPHVKGKWASRNELLVLGDWQVFVVVNIYGFKLIKKRKKLNIRRFRDVYIEVPRKNGKTFFIAGIGLTMLAMDNEFGAEIYCGATSEKQALEVFRPAKQICERDSDFREHFLIQPHARSILIEHQGSKFEPVIGNPGDGASPSCGIADEYHEHKTSDLVDTFVTGMGAREQPLMLQITTAGSDMGGPCYEKRDDVKKVLDGSVEDDSVFGIIYTIDEGDQWDTIEAQKKANPNYGISVDEDFLVNQLNQARRSAVKQTAYKTKHLNLWVGAKAAWMNMLAFQACRKKALDIGKFKGRPCFVGMDLASKIDVASMAIYFPKHNGKRAAMFHRHYLPEEVVFDGGNTRYKAWHASGHLIITPGNIIDHEWIESDLVELSSQVEIQEVVFDPFQATQFSIHLVEKGFPMVEFGATVKNFSEPMKQLEALIVSKALDFSLDPVLLWMMGNVVAKIDKKDNIFPDKEREGNKIDGVVASIMALGRSMVFEDPTSIYEDSEIKTL